MRYVAPFQLQLRQGTDLFPVTTQMPSVVRTHVETDLTAAAQTMHSLLGDAYSYMQLASAGRDIVVPETDGLHVASLNDADVEPSRPPVDQQVYIAAAQQSAGAAAQLGQDVGQFLQDLPNRASEQLAKYAPTVSQFVLGQRQMVQSGVAPGQRTHLNLPDLEARYTSLQGAEMIDLKVKVPFSRAQPAMPGNASLKLPGKDNPYLDMIAVNFNGGAD